jgi:hypothetical protein
MGHVLIYISMKLIAVEKVMVVARLAVVVM